MRIVVALGGDALARCVNPGGRMTAPSEDIGPALANAGGRGGPPSGVTA